MKNTFTLLLFLGVVFSLMHCTPTASTTLEQDKQQTSISAEEKEQIKEELKEELKDEIKKELEAEEKVTTTTTTTTTRPPRPTRPTTTVGDPPIKDTKPPSKPEKPAMDVSTANNILRGAWEWIETAKSIRGVGNQIDVPSVIGYRKTAVFKSDNIVDILLNDIPSVTYTYEVTKGVDRLFIKFTSTDGDTRHMENGPLLLTDNEFEILGGFNDAGGTIKFKRL